MMHPETRSAFADYIRRVAEWRRARYDDDLRDPRHLRSAAAIEGFAEYVISLPDDDARIGRLTKLCMRGEAFEPTQRLAYELGRFHFFTDEASVEGFLDQLVQLAEADHGERGRFGGPQAPGDDPWH
jgi:hypothetical protein